LDGVFSVVVSWEEQEGEVTVKEDKKTILCWSTLELKPSEANPMQYTKVSRPKRKRAQSICYKPKRRKTFQEKHKDYCEACEAGGDLLCCDSCTTVWHLTCLELELVPEGKWECPLCVEDAADQQWDDHCKECGLGGELLCCDYCPKAVHIDCAVPKLEDIPEGAFACSDCADPAQGGPKASTPPATPAKNEAIPCLPPCPGSTRSTSSHTSAAQQPTAAMTAAEEQMTEEAAAGASSGAAGPAAAGGRRSRRLGPKPPETLTSITVG